MAGANTGSAGVKRKRKVVTATCNVGKNAAATGATSLKSRRKAPINVARPRTES
jgi:hypothetical protein